MATLEERREAYAAKVKELDARIAKKRAQEKAQERKYRDHALIQLGGIVLKELGLTWDTIDPEKFARQFAEIAPKHYGGDEARPVFDCSKGSTTAKAAHECWLDFQHMQRGGKE